MSKQNQENRKMFQFDLSSMDAAKLKKMQAALDAAYNCADPKKRANFKKIFGDKKPTLKEFIEGIAREAYRRNIN